MLTLHQAQRLDSQHLMIESLTITPQEVIRAVASRLMCSTAERTVLVRALNGDNVWCSWAGHLTVLSQCLSSIQVYFKCLPANVMFGVTLRWTIIRSRGSRKTPSRFMLQETEISSGLMSSLARMQTLTSFTVQARILLAIYADALWALHHPTLGIV